MSSYPSSIKLIHLTRAKPSRASSNSTQIPDKNIDERTFLNLFLSAHIYLNFGENFSDEKILKKLTQNHDKLFNFIFNMC